MVLGAVMAQAVAAPAGASPRVGCTARRISACGAVLLAVAGLSACGGGSGGSDGVVARVGETPITSATLAHWQSIKGDPNGATAPNPTTAGAGRHRQQALGFLIASQWTLGEAAELGVRVTTGEARKQLERFKYIQLERIGYQRFPREAQLRKSLASPGETFADQVWLTRLNMLAAGIEQERLAQLERQLTPTQVTAYYRAHSRRFLLPAARDMEIIMTYKQAATEKAKREIQSGKSFLSVARRVSVDPEATEGRQHLVRGREEPEFEEHVFAAKPYVLEGPIHQALDYYVFEVTKITPAREQTLAQSQASIRRQLAAQRLRQVSAQLLQAGERRWIARTDCRPGYVVAQCRQYTGATS
jgi:foldase protein PrsA